MTFDVRSNAMRLTRIMNASDKLDSISIEGFFRGGIYHVNASFDGNELALYLSYEALREVLIKSSLCETTKIVHDTVKSGTMYPIFISRE